MESMQFCGEKHRSLGKIEKYFLPKLMDYFIQGVKKQGLKLYFVFDKPCDKLQTPCFCNIFY
jgi:hypothetical protein